MKKIKVFITMALAIIFSLTLKGSVNAVPIYYVDGNSTLNSEYGYTMNLNNISGDRIEVSSNFRWSDYKYLTAGTQLYNVWTAEWPSKGDTWIRYKNVGAVNGRSIDLKVTLADYGSIQAIRNGSVQPQVVYYANSYNFYMIGMSDTILRYEFLASGTNDRVDFKGYLSLLDLDWAQYVEAVSGVDSMYILNGTRLYVDGNAIRSRVEDDNQNDDANPQFLAQVFINNGAEIKVSTTRWTADLAIYSLGMSSLAPFEQPQPTKNVDKAVTHVGETVTYTINQFIPMEDPSYLYDNFVISDNISSAFTIQSGNVKVLDQNNNDASYIFDISINGNNVSARMKWDYLRNQGYYSNTYKLVIPCTVNSNLIGFTNANGTYIDNNSSVTTTRGTKTTNTVTTEVKYQISTSIDHGSITDTIYDIKGGSSRTVYFTPQKGYYISKIVVDGVEQNINNFNMLGDSYTISNISSNHSVQVYTLPMRIRIKIDKQDKETGKTIQADAKFEGAEYSIYKDANCTNFVEKLTVDKNGYATSSDLLLVDYVNGSYNYTETYYVKETKAPTGYNIDTNVYTVYQNTASQNVKVAEQTVTSKEKVIKNSIEITKYIEETDSTLKQKLSGVVFKAVLNSDTSKVYYSTQTDNNGKCVISDLPYGTYTISEVKIPGIAFDGKFHIGSSNTRQIMFEQFIGEDKSKHSAYVYGDITNIAKKMQITVYKEDTETGTITQGDAHLENAEYTLYRDAACTDAVETLTIAKNTDGTYSATSGWYLVGTYYVKETKAPEGYLIDEKVYTVAQDPAAQTEEYTKHIVTSKDNVKRNNIDITKYLEKTDSTEKQNLAGAEFTAQLVSKNSPDSNKLYKAVTDANGNCTIKDLPYGTYRVWESKVPDTAYNGEFYINGAQTRSTSFEQFIELDKTEREAYRYADITDVAKKMQITVYKEDTETGTTTQGDARLENAEYTLYRDAACTDAVETLTIAKNEDGTYSATSGWYLVGTYYVKETKAPEGYLIDEKVYTVAQDPAAQKDEHTKHTILSKDKVMEGMVKGIKYNNNSIMSEKTPAVGAKLRLTLDSNPEVYYEGIVDENGYLEFVDTIDDTHYSSTETHCKETCYPYTIPYGVYTISEVQKSNSGENIFINKQKTEIRYEGQTQRYILDDEYVRMRLTITIKDSETQKLVPGGATYKIWDVNNQRWYEEMIYPSGEKVTEFTTDEKGQLTINRHLEAGSYVIYEVKAPEGYYLNDELREGSKGYEFTIGVVQNGDVKLYHDDSEVTLSYVEMPYDNVPTKIYSYTAETYNDPQKAEIDIEKLAKQFSKVQSQESEYGKVSSPVFEEKGLAKVSFKLIAAEDIVTPEGTVRYTKGQVVSNIKTDKEGKAQTEKVYLGKYILEEVETPNGYINTTEPKEITIEYTNQYEKVQYLGQNISNETQKVELEFEKVYKELEVSKFKFDEKEAIFGIYTKEPVKNYKGESVIGKDELVDVIKTDDENKLRNNVELPEGKYYVKELYVSSPYAKTNDTYEFSVEYKNNKDEKIELTVNNGKVQNEASTAELELIVYPDVVYDELEIAKEKDRDTLEKLAELYGIEDKTYGVYLDEKCEKAVQTIDGEEARFKTNEDGIIDIPDMPTGTYYLKEIEAPYGYEKSEEVIKAEINEEGKLVLLTAKEPTKKAKILRKYDTFTKDVIEGVEFEITDKEENVVYTGKTNKQGEIEVPIIYFENEEKYYYEEKTAPKMYKADEEKYEFTAKVDEEKCEWKAEKIEVGNDRKTIEEVVIRKTDSKTGEALKGCVFTIALLDDEGKEYVNSQGETIYLVKEGVTNEEGEYVIKNVPYGRYRFIEVKAPEGYEMDEDMTGLEFTVDENSPEKIIFEVTNTGDIAVVALVIVAVVCVAGIVFVVVKNKKKNSK